MPDLVVTFNGQTMRLNMPVEFTGKVEVNVIRGDLGARGSKVAETLPRCKACGSSDVGEVTLVRGLLDQPGVAGKNGGVRR